MIRNMIEERGVGYETDFRWRGGNVSRIEGLSAAVLLLRLRYWSFLCKFQNLSTIKFIL